MKRIEAEHCKRAYTTARTIAGIATIVAAIV